MRLRLFGLPLLLCSAAITGCVWLSGNRVPVYNVANAPIDYGGAIEQTGEQIRRAARMQNWEIEEVRPDLLYVTKRRGQHVATAAISYDVDSFSIQLRSSIYLKQTEDGRIHKLYNEWVRSLESTVRRELASGGSTPHDPDPRVTSGTCFAVRPDGYLLTSAHVISGASEISVRLSDGQTLPARVAASHPESDIALLSVDIVTPRYLSLAGPESPRVGQRVFTIGYPMIQTLGAEPKFTDGSVSALSGAGGEETQLQISAPVQPGNSGGPLMNDGGEVLGVVIATADPRTFYAAGSTFPQNVNWAVKSERATSLYEPPMPIGKAKGRDEAIERTLAALCMVTAVHD